MAYFLSPALAQLRAEVNRLWPHRDKTSDGWIGDASHAARPSDHNPDYSDGGIVRAVDIDEDLVAGLTAAGEAMPLVNQIIRDARTRYVIYEGRIWTRENGWRPYNGVNAHRHHIHVSVRSVGNYDRDASSWGITRSTSTGGGGGSVTIPDVPGGLPAPPKEDDMPTLKEIGDEIWGRLVTNRAGKKVAVGAFIESLPKETADEVLKRPVTVNGTRQTLGAALQSTAINAAVAVRLSQAAAQGQRLSDEEIKRIADETAAQIDLVSTTDVVDEIGNRLTGKEN